MITTYLWTLLRRPFRFCLRRMNTAPAAGILIGLWAFAIGAGIGGWWILPAVLAFLWALSYLAILQSRVNYLAGEVRRYRDEQRLWTEFRNLSYLRSSDDDERTAA